MSSYKRVLRISVIAVGTLVLVFWDRRTGEVIIGLTRAVLLALLIIEFSRSGGAKNPRCIIPSVQRLTTHRKPIWVVEVSSDCGDRAAGRYRRQYSGAHKCDPPFNALRIVESAAGAAVGEGPQHGDVTTCLA